MWSTRGQGDRRNSGAVAEALGMQMVLVKTTGGSHDALRGVVPSAPLRQCHEELMEVDIPWEAEPRPLPFTRVFGGSGSSASVPVPRPRD